MRTNGPGTARPSAGMRRLAGRGRPAPRALYHDPMPNPLLPAWSKVTTPVIGMVHLRPLPGAPRYRGDWPAVVDAMTRDATALVDGGAHGLLLENFGDAPFHPGAVPAHVVASITALGAALRRAHPDVPLGINVLRNDGCAALAVAAALGAQFVRVNVLCGARLTDQGLVSGIAHDLLRLRRTLGADAVGIWADVDVKHSAPLAPITPQREAADLVHRGLADALIVSGAATGRPVDVAAIERVAAAAPDVPILAGSGVDPANAADLAARTDGLIVGTSLKRDGRVEAPVDLDRVRDLVGRVSAGAAGPIERQDR